MARHTGLARHMALEETTNDRVSVVNCRSPEGSRAMEVLSSMIDDLALFELLL